ncbi:protein-glutamate methylesterase/protein-glutamine glutaminase [Sphingobium subterraneum]|uniref:Protein-glutamate methylesterase/protein-glutamine glutaminase n=1 Tax=Sphingobium subterraneum TaxID=627688 RepID=A0A841J5J4_9SPHN|nr:chemotaxis response regulator protein-glutamate methylesterase [Sphingobium subterraneum]MBB6123491.1 two-component system chemotaxis response regulator CheB [Sphingobium subterraneum]
MTTRVLIVDDSATMRALLSRLLGSEPDIEVIGTAADAMEARGMIRELNPDVVTLDIEMPGMNGLEFLDKIMRLRPMPVVIVSGVTKRNCETTIRALELGAVDCYAKPDGSVNALLENDGGDLARMVRSAGRIGRWRAPEALQQQDRVQRQTIAVSTVNGVGTRLIAIGASTGGVEALHHLLPAFPENCPPTLIVQHISAAFAPAMADRLNQRCAATVQLAEPGIPLQEGHIYIAGGNERHMVVSGTEKLVTRAVPGDLVSGHRPSIDALFESVAKALGPAAVGILLTGMGQDGARGLLAMRKAGGRTIAQDEATSTVYGMPRAAADIGAAEKILPLPRIAERALAGARA